MWISGKEEVKRRVPAGIINYWTYGSLLIERVITFLFGPEKYVRYISFYQALPDLLAQHGYRLIDVPAFKKGIVYLKNRKSGG